MGVQEGRRARRARRGDKPPAGKRTVGAPNRSWAGLGAIETERP
jgi:hypothetical protein